MLEFRDAAQFQQVLDCLDAAVEANNDAFEAKYSNLSDDEVEVIEEKTGFNEDQPLIDFENSKRFVSLRSSVETAIVAWLDHDNLDPNTDPDDITVDDEVMRTVLNTAYKVKVGGQIYDFSVAGGGSPDATCCKKWLSGGPKFVQYEGGAKQFKIKGSVRDFGIVSVAKSKVVSFKKKSNGHWKRYKTRLVANVAGTGFNSDCTKSAAFGGTKGPKRKKHLTVKVTVGIGSTAICVKPGTTVASCVVSDNMVPGAVAF